MKLKWPRDEYYFGPLIIRAQMIEPFVIPAVFIGLRPDIMHEIKFDSMEERADFVNALDTYQDSPVEVRRDLLADA